MQDLSLANKVPDRCTNGHVPKPASRELDHGIYPEAGYIQLAVCVTGIYASLCANSLVQALPRLG